MPKSMTGYGRWSGQSAALAQTWEIKSVNGKQLSIRWKMPQFLSMMEQDWEKQVRATAERGRVDIHLHLHLFEAAELAPKLNTGTAQSMLDQLRQLAHTNDDPFELDYSHLLRLPSLWEDPDQAPPQEILDTLQSGLENALMAWNQSREREGRAMLEDVRQRVETVGHWVQTIAERVPSLPQQRFALLKQRAAALLEDQPQGVSPERLHQELALLTDRIDVSEEITRLQTHLQELQRRLATAAPSGRHMDFLLQECFREINTCGNKAQDSEVSRLVVDVKTELEKCREQVQNIE
ncbi:MAG: YicC/YloC family endoribonuclease [Thermodesulfobacteriota bacterium]